jgi:hypothetical protein
LIEARFSVPIVFIIFNRPEPTQIVFDVIAQIRPTHLLVIADGPRASRTEDKELCQRVRSIADQVTWDCEVSVNFAEENLGCQKRIISGLDWAFSLVAEAIILEDDCLPDLSFFPFCEQMLERYRDDPRVGMISGTNFVQKKLKTEYSYFFSQTIHIWGWATWRSSWQRYDRHLSRWPEIKRARLLSEVFDDPRVAAYWTERFDEMYSGTGPNTWDYQWVYTNLVNHSLSIVPRVNLVTNIGFGPDATHTVASGDGLKVETEQIDFPLLHPPSLLPLRSMDRIDQKLNVHTLLQKFAYKARRVQRTFGEKT